MNFVIVDDEPKIKNGLVKLISSHKGWNVIGAFEDASTAFKFICENRPDILITDIKMPEISGLELIRQIREISEEIQIIILSGYGEFSFAQKAIELGVYRYLTKPTNVKELISVIKSIEEMYYAETEINETTNFIVSKAIDYIEKNYANKITLKKLSEELYISSDYLCRLFKHHTDKNISDYILECRMKKAEQYLKNVQLNISEVSEMVGFNNAKYFSTSFRKIYNMTPTEYRNTLLNKT